MARNLKGKSVVITGGASGIGLTTTKYLAKAGACVSIFDVQDQLGEAVASELSQEGHNVQFVHCDVTSWDSQVAAFKRAVEFSPSKTLDVAICSAGTQDKQDARMVTAIMNAGEPSLAAEPPKAPTLAIDVNLMGMYYTAWLACYYFRLNGRPEPGSKSIVLIGSLSGHKDFANTPTTYLLSKWGVRGLFHSIRHDVERIGARVNLVAPFWVATPLVSLFKEGETPLGGWTDINDVAETIVDCAGNPTIDARAFGVFAPPIRRVDLEDNIEGAYSGEVMRRIAAELGYTNPKANPVAATSATPVPAA